MQAEKIKHTSIELKIIKLDMERISMKLEDNNRAIKETLVKGDLATHKEDLKEMVEFNRFLLQKLKEKTADKRRCEDLLKNLILEENKHESKLIESEKRLAHFMLTIDKSLEFNADHPFYDDASFIKDLIKEFLKREDYETCARLKKRLEEVSIISVN